MRGLAHIFAVLQQISPMTNLYAIVIIVHLILHHMSWDLFSLSLARSPSSFFLSVYYAFLDFFLHIVEIEKNPILWIRFILF